MAGLDVTSVYRAVIDDVITRSRPEFVQEGVDEAVLEELRVLWEEKLQQSGVLAPEPARPMPGGIPGSQVMAAPYAQPPNAHVPSYYPVRAPGQPGIGQPPPYMAASVPWQPQPPQASSAAASQAGGVPYAQLYAQLGTARPAGHSYASSQHFAQEHAQSAPVGALQHGQQQQYRQPPAGQPGGAYQQALLGQPALQMQPQPDSRKRPAEVPQAGQWPKMPAVKPEPRQQHNIPQQDGPADEGKEGEAAAEAVDNLSDVPSSDEEEGDVPNHCISQFTKVQRTKNRWKCQLMAGVLHLNGRDHVFQAASGEFQF